jgi:hypothetical protein
MQYGYVKPSSGKLVAIAICAKSQSGSPVTREAEYQKTKDETRVDEIKARAASVPLRLTLG